MISKETFVQRVEDITRAVEQSMANHNALVGRLEEAKFFLSEIEKGVELVAEVAGEQPSNEPA